MFQNPLPVDAWPNPAVRNASASRVVNHIISHLKSHGISFPQLSHLFPNRNSSGRSLYPSRSTSGEVALRSQPSLALPCPPRSMDQASHLAIHDRLNSETTEEEGKDGHATVALVSAFFSEHRHVHQTCHQLYLALMHVENCFHSCFKLLRAPSHASRLMLQTSRLARAISVSLGAQSDGPLQAPSPSPPLACSPF